MLLPAPSKPAPAPSTQANVNRLVRDYAIAKDIPFNQVWNALYAELYYACNVNIQVRARNAEKKPIDMVAELGLMEDLYAVACEKLKL